MNGMLRVWLLCLCMACLLGVSACSSKRISAYGPSQQAMRQYTLGQRVVQTAQKQIGRKYRFGGESPSRGFDCSGLIWWAYRVNGVNVPRVTGDQAGTGVRVSPRRAQPDDILVFKTGRFWGGLHTALYVGNGRFIHSPSSGKRVRIDTLASEYWGPRLRDVRRIVR